MFGPKWPKNPKAMLEARYKAYTKGDVQFILDSCHPDIRGNQNRKEIERWSKESKWLGLYIEEDSDDGNTGFVKFTCRYEQNGEDVVHREIAEFRKHEDGKWYYYDSRSPTATFRREEPKVGRNDPCPCGSGKKFKKCCGA